MILEPLIDQLIQDLELGDVKLSTEIPGVYKFPLEEGVTIIITEIPTGFILKCPIAPYPKVKDETFSANLMLGNLFGQGTRGSVLGLSLDGTMLNQSRVIEYPVDNKEFKNILEDFINSVDFWREEALNYK